MMGRLHVRADQPLYQAVCGNVEMKHAFRWSGSVLAGLTLTALVSAFPCAGQAQSGGQSGGQSAATPLPQGITFPLAYRADDGKVFLYVGNSDPPLAQNQSLVGAYAGDNQGLYRLYTLSEDYIRLQNHMVGLKLSFEDLGQRGLKAKAEQDAKTGDLVVTCNEIVTKLYTPMFPVNAAALETRLIDGEIPVHQLPDSRNPIRLYHRPRTGEFIYTDAPVLGDLNGDRMYIGPAGALKRVDLASIVASDCGCGPDFHTTSGGVLSHGKWRPSPDAAEETLEEVNFYMPMPPGQLSGTFDAQGHELDFGPVANTEIYDASHGIRRKIDVGVLAKFGVDATAFSPPKLITPCTP